MKHLLWHGNAEEALERIGGLNIELDLLRAFSPAADKLGKNLGEFETYIRNNIEFIPNFGERCRQGETINTAFVESTINQVVSKRFVKKQQMEWTPRGAKAKRGAVPPWPPTSSAPRRTLSIIQAGRRGW